jgi:hypothetical protein
MASPMKQQLEQKAVEYFEAFDTLDPNRLVPLLASNCEHHYAPASLALPSPLTNDAYAEHVANLRNAFSLFHVRPKPNEIHVDVEGKKVTMWSVGSAHIKEELRDDSEPADWWEDDKGEYIHHFTFDESGDKLLRSVEFMDSARTEKLKVMFGKALGNIAKKQGAA